MNRDDIIRMAQECGLTINGNVMLGVERFAALVAAAEREAYQHVHRLLEAHQAALEASEKPGPWPAKEVIAKAVAAEREACARMFEEDSTLDGQDRWELAELIRARGEVETKTPDYLEKCPNCNGPADNGFDRSWPDPNPYYCTKCMKAMEY